MIKQGSMIYYYMFANVTLKLHLGILKIIKHSL